jgi:hypothetical protein
MSIRAPIRAFFEAVAAGSPNLGAPASQRGVDLRRARAIGGLAVVSIEPEGAAATASTGRFVGGVGP